MFIFFTEGDQNCLKQLVAAITTRLFNPDNVRDRNWDLSSHNTILALGHIAVTLHTQVPSDDIGKKYLLDLKILFLTKFFVIIPITTYVFPHR